MLSLVMPIYVVPGREDVVHACLDSLGSQTEEFDEKIVILNGPPPNTELVDRLKGFTSSGLLYGLLTYDIPLGFAKAFNQGLRMSKGDIIMLSSDVSVKSNWLNILLEESAGVDGVVCCGDVRWHREFYEDRARGASFLLPRRVFEKVGFWEEDLNWRLCDQAYWIRCKQEGFRVCLSGKARVYHHGGHTWKHLLSMNPELETQEADEKKIMKKRYDRATSFRKWLGRSTISQQK